MDCRSYQVDQELPRPGLASGHSVKRISWNPIKCDDDSINYGHWHEVSCRQFLIEGIQQMTAASVQGLINSPRLLERHLFRQMVSQSDSNDCLHILSLLPGEEPRNDLGPNSIDNDVDTEFTALTNSQSSIGSQVSDSGYNDVQQSAFLLLENLRIVKKRLLALEKRKFPGTWVTRKNILQGEVKDVWDAIENVVYVLRTAQPDMGTIGFTDVGFQLNEHEQEFNEFIMKRLTTTDEPDETRTERLIHHLFGRAKKSKFAWCSNYQNTTSYMHQKAVDVQKVLDYALRVRDDYLSAAYSVLNPLLMAFTTEKGIQRHDRFESQILVEKQFIYPRDKFIQDMNFSLPSPTNSRIIIDHYDK